MQHIQHLYTTEPLFAKRLKDVYFLGLFGMAVWALSLLFMALFVVEDLIARIIVFLLGTLTLCVFVWVMKNRRKR